MIKISNANPDGSHTNDPNHRPIANHHGPLTLEGSPKNSRGSKTRGLYDRDFECKLGRITRSTQTTDRPPNHNGPLTPEGSPKNSRRSKTRGLHVM